MAESSDDNQTEIESGCFFPVIIYACVVPMLIVSCPEGPLLPYFKAHFDATDNLQLMGYSIVFGSIPTSLNFAILLNTLYGGAYYNSKIGVRKVGCLYKSVTDVLGIGVPLSLRYYFNGICISLIWVSVVLEFQILRKMRYDPPDLGLSDLFIGVLMQITLVYKKEDAYNSITKIMLCLLIIYHRHWSTPSSRTILSESEEISQGEAEFDSQQLTTTIKATGKILEDV